MLWTLLVLACTSTGKPADGAADGDSMDGGTLDGGQAEDGGTATEDGGTATEDGGAATEDGGDDDCDGGAEKADCIDGDGNWIDPEGLPDCSVAETWGTGKAPEGECGTREECVHQHAWSAACCELPTKLDEDTVIYSQNSVTRPGWVSPYEVVTDEAAWLARWAAVEWAGEPPASIREIDWHSEYVVIVVQLENETCGFRNLQTGSWTTASGAPGLVLRAEDSSGNTDPCAAEGGAVAIFALPRDGCEPVVCSAEVETC